MILVLSSKMRYYNSGELINSEIKKATIILNNKKSNFYYIKKNQNPKTIQHHYLLPLAPTLWLALLLDTRGKGVSWSSEDSGRGDR